MKVVPVKKKRRGRPPGRRNNLTLLKEAEMKKAMSLATSHMIEHLPALVKTLVDKANDGDMAAMKMVLDRVIPTRKAVEHINSSDERPTVNVNISIGKPKATAVFGDIVDAEVVDDGDSV